MNDAIKKHVAKFTKDIGSIQILNTYFIYINASIIMFNGHEIPVIVYRNDMAKVECVEFLDIPILRAAVGPIHFISLNRIYNFDDSLYVSSENFIFTPDYDIFEKVIKFIERYGGHIYEIDEDKEYILFSIDGIDTKNHICIDIMYLKEEDGFIYEVSKILKHTPYSTEYDKFASNFITEFKPKNQSISIDLATF